MCQCAVDLVLFLPFPPWHNWWTKMIKQLGYLLSLIILRIIPLPLPGQPPHNSHSAAYKGENAVSINTALLILFTFQGERVHSEENICYWKQTFENKSQEVQQIFLRNGQWPGKYAKQHNKVHEWNWKSRKAKVWLLLMFAQILHLLLLIVI